MKRRNRTWGCKRIAQQIALAFEVDIDKDVVRRILATHFHPESESGGPSSLSVIAMSDHASITAGDSAPYAPDSTAITSRHSARA